ncbi:MAG TPA: 3-dehydroquinate synthase, partial [Verrucomicrobiae bacterium]|nr:3-dehydroquinate synthase [Verrucomicrobiae bacterium]
METLKVGLGDRSYDIAIGADILQDIGPLCFSAGLRGKAAVVTNPVVAPLYLGSVRRSLESAGFLPLVTEIPDGEEHKGAQALNDIYSFLITSGVDRRSFVVALGGGVVGDMAGFAAATYLRGIDFIQVPTTLLAQVDSSVGGKTGINHPLGKNLIGAFHQPRLVLADVGTLRSLSRRDYLAGLAEVVKYGCVLDAAFFSFIEEHVAELEARDAVVLQQIVRRSCELKASVVEKDETEQGLRAVLNYGHTFAHAVESLGEYRTHRHG